MSPSKHYSASPAPQHVVAPVPAPPVPTPRYSDARPVPVTPPRVRSHRHHPARTQSTVQTTNTPTTEPHPPLIPPDDTEPMPLHHYNLRPRQTAIAFLAAQLVHPEFLPYSRHHANSVLDTLSGREVEYRQLSRGPDAEVWIKALSNDLGRLAQRVGARILAGTNTIFFILHSSVSPGKTITYGRLISSLRPKPNHIA